jgi:hypothetical protein
MNQSQSIHVQFGSHFGTKRAPPEGVTLQYGTVQHNPFHEYSTRPTTQYITTTQNFTVQYDYQ